MRTIPNVAGILSRRMRVGRGGHYLAMAKCLGITPAGVACKANPRTGLDYCRWHDPSKEARAQHRAQSSRGGLQKAYGSLPTADAIADVFDMDTLDLESPRGCRALVGAVLRQLAHLPLDVRIANCIGQLATAQRGLIESSNMMRRLEALEAAAPTGSGAQPLPTYRHRAGASATHS